MDGYDSATHSDFGTPTFVVCLLIPVRIAGYILLLLRLLLPLALEHLLEKLELGRTKGDTEGQDTNGEKLHGGCVYFCM